MNTKAADKRPVWEEGLKAISGRSDGTVVLEPASDAGAIESPTGGPKTFQEPKRLAAFEEQLPAVLERIANGVAVTMTLSPTVTAEVTPLESFLSTSGTFCRKARYKLVKQEAPPPTEFTACRADNGIWEIVSIYSPADE